MTKKNGQYEGSPLKPILDYPQHCFALNALLFSPSLWLLIGFFLFQDFKNVYQFLP